MSTNQSNEFCIEFDNVLAGYKDFMILNNLSLKARRGKITLLLGPNGAGKSTVLKTLFGLLTPRLGRVLLDGEDIGGIDPKSLLAKGWLLCRKDVTYSLSLPLKRTWS